VLSELQRRDAIAQLGKHTPARSISLIPSRRRLLIFGVVAMAFALLLLLPNPMTAVLQQRAAFQARVAKQIAAIDHIRSLLDSQTPTSDGERKQIDQILHDLQTQLQNAQNETQAQQALSQAQAKLTQLRDPQATNKAQANAAAAASLQNSSNSNLSSAGQALANGDNKQLANALQNLASQVSKLSPSQRAQLAQQIEQAAGQASQNSELSNALHQLAKAVADGSQSDISDAINAVENTANQDNAEQAQANKIDQTSQALQQVANSLASATDQSSNPSQSQNTGQGQQPSQGQQQGQGQQSGQGQGQQDQGQGQGQNQQNGADGHGGTGGKNGTGNKSGQDEQVFIPGQVGSGSSLQNNNGNNGVIQPGSPINYSQVIEQYTQMAHDAIDNSSVSPDLKDLVHGYFDSLEGQ
jgi:chemotaxis protein histidine kinase CheA